MLLIWIGLFSAVAFCVFSLKRILLAARSETISRRRDRAVQQWLRQQL
jgi:hypothetical protein